MYLVRTCLITAGLFAFGTSADAGIIFSEDFQAPDITGYAQKTTPTGWVKGSGPFGADRHGLIDENSGAFTGVTAAFDGEQAYAFRYTSSPSIVTAEGTIGNLAIGDYTFTFDVQQDLGDSEFDADTPATAYKAALVAFDSGATRTQYGASGQSFLVSEQSSVAAGPTWTTVTLTFTVESDNVHVGKDVGVAFGDIWSGSDGKGNSSAVIDNAQLKFVPVPEPGSLALLGLGGLLIGTRRRK